MAKTQDELKELKLEFETLTSKLKELTDEEIMQVTGGSKPFNPILIHNNDIFSAGYGLTLMVYTGQKRTIEDPDELLPFKLYVRDSYKNPEPRFRFLKNANVSGRIIVCECNPSGNVADGKFVLID